MRKGEREEEEREGEEREEEKKRRGRERERAVRDNKSRHKVWLLSVAIWGLEGFLI